MQIINTWGDLFSVLSSTLQNSLKLRNSFLNVELAFCHIWEWRLFWAITLKGCTSTAKSPRGNGEEMPLTVASSFLSVVLYRTWARVLGTLGFRYKMRSVCAHFPNSVFRSMVFLLNMTLLGWKYTRRVGMRRGVEGSVSSQERWVNSRRKWPWTCIKWAALIQQATTVKNKVSENMGWCLGFWKRNSSLQAGD